MTKRISADQLGHLARCAGGAFAGDNELVLAAQPSSYLSPLLVWCVIGVGMLAILIGYNLIG